MDLQMKKVGVAIVLALILVGGVQGGRPVPKNDAAGNGGGGVDHPENIYGGVGGVGGVIPIANPGGGGPEPVVVSGGTTFNCPYPGLPIGCTVNTLFPGAGAGGGATPP